MEEFSAYELAQQRIEQRQRKRNHTYLWLFLAVFCIPLSFAAGNCAVPLAIIAVTFAVLSGIDWYFASERGRPGSPQVAQEMVWLFGESWEGETGVHEFALALERVHKRRRARVKFIFHLVLFLLVNGLFTIIMIDNLTRFREPVPIPVLIIMLGWMAVLAYHGFRAFPTQRMLVVREQEAGEAIRREIEQMQPAKRKNKLKRDVYYVLGDDGELVEVDQEMLENEKPKHRPHRNGDEL